jgi:hypothetical protein
MKRSVTRSSQFPRRVQYTVHCRESATFSLHCSLPGKRHIHVIIHLPERVALPTLLWFAARVLSRGITSLHAAVTARSLIGLRFALLLKRLIRSTLQDGQMALKRTRTECSEPTWLAKSVKPAIKQPRTHLATFGKRPWHTELSRGFHLSQEKVGGKV